MAMLGLTFYGDASGSPADAPIMFVSGFVSTAEKWKKFEAEWADLLDRYKITPPFHMKEFAPGWDQYASWKADKEKRQAFLADAIDILKHRTNKSFSVGVIPKDLQEVNQTYETPSVYHYPYALCGTRVIALVNNWIKRRLRKQRGRPEPIEFFFERGDTHQPAFERELRKLIPELQPMFRDKTLSPLQSADFVAWLHARAMKFHMGVAKWGDVLEILDTLSRRLPNEKSWEFMSKEAMLRTCERKGWPRRHLATRLRGQP